MNSPSKYFAHSISILTIIAMYMLSPQLHAEDQALTALEIYSTVWNEPDPAIREKLLEESWNEKGVYTDPGRQLIAREELNPVIDGFKKAYPGAIVVATSEIDKHHNIFRVSWQVLLENGEPYLVGEDFGELDNDGKILRLNSFFGPLKPKAES